MTMKRDTNLAPLSREHLSALMLVYRLKHGRSSNPRYPWPKDPNEQKQRVLSMWKNELQWHFEAEERFLFAPFHTLLSSTAQQIGETLLTDHADIKALILDLDSLEKSELQVKLQYLGERLEKHVRLEEREYFELLQSEIPPEKLLEAGHKILDFYAQRPPFYCAFTGEWREIEA